MQSNIQSLCAGCFCYATSSFERNKRESIFEVNVLRLILVLLLSVAVPSHGSASMVRYDHCPVHAHVASVDKATVSDPCCDGKGGSGHDSNDTCSKLCTLGGDCRSANLLQSAIGPEPGVTSHTRASPGVWVRIAILDPSRVWRPPRFV